MMTPSLLLACGSCTDSAISRLAPFLFYWALLFGIWALLWGVPGTVLALFARARLSMRPLRYLGAAVLLVVVAAPFSGGSVLLPMLLFLPVWLLRLVRSRVVDGPVEFRAARRLERVATRVRRCTLSIVVLLIPVGYASQYFQNNPDAYPLGEWLLVPPSVAAAGSMVLLWALSMVFLDRYRRAKSPNETNPWQAEDDAGPVPGLSSSPRPCGAERAGARPPKGPFACSS